MLVEVCANSLESALIAQEAGADRIELCSELGVGGVTPSHGLIEMVKNRLDIPIHVLIRPRSGHFTYTDLEFEVMLKDITFCEEIGVDGIVSGVLLSDNSLDENRTSVLVKASKPMKFTFHRAFDWVPDPKKALIQIEALGVDYILTSGQQTSAEEGLDLLQKLHHAAKNIIVMAGGGVGYHNCNKFKQAGLHVIHLSGSGLATDFNDFPKNKICMNTISMISDSEVYLTKAEKIKSVLKVLGKLPN